MNAAAKAETAPEDDIVILGIRREDDWNTLQRVVARPRTVGVIVVTPDAEASSLARAVAAGAIGWAPRTSAMDQIFAVVETALAGLVAVPRITVRALVEDRPPPAAAPRLSDDQLRCLELLAEGATVVQVGRDCGFSERESYRVLERIYRGLGVTNRSEALVRAARLGLIGGQAERANGNGR